MREFASERLQLVQVRRPRGVIPLLTRAGRYMRREMGGLCPGGRGGLVVAVVIVYEWLRWVRGNGGGGGDSAARCCSAGFVFPGRTQPHVDNLTHGPTMIPVFSFSQHYPLLLHVFVCGLVSIHTNQQLNVLPID